MAVLCSPLDAPCSLEISFYHYIFGLYIWIPVFFFTLGFHEEKMTSSLPAWSLVISGTVRVPPLQAYHFPLHSIGASALISE